MGEKSDYCPAACKHGFSPNQVNLPLILIITYKRSVQLLQYELLFYLSWLFDI